MVELSTGNWVLVAGLVIGVVFGVTGQRTGFCLNSAIRRQLFSGDGNKLRSFLLAIAVATLGTQLAVAAGLLDLSKSIYLPNKFSWLLVIVGGLMFGYGMILARGCGARTLVLFAQGNLRSLVVLLCMGVTAFATLTGVLAPVRTALAELTQVTLAHSTFESTALRWGFVMVFCSSLLIFVFSRKGFVKHRRDLVAGLVIGALVVAGWLTTGWLGADDFEPVPLVSLTFVGPVGATIQYSMIATGTSLTFGIVTVMGVLLGAHVSSRLNGTFELVGFEAAADMPRYIGGGVLMGVGGALAMGCSIGQGITGLSTLSYVSMLAFGSIAAGAWLALRRDLSGHTAPKPV